MIAWGVGGGGGIFKKGDKGKDKEGREQEIIKIKHLNRIEH